MHRKPLLNLFPEWSELWRVADEQIMPAENEFVVTGHATPGGELVKGRVLDMTPERLWKEIELYKGWQDWVKNRDKGKLAIRLIICWVGSGENSFAERLYFRS